MKYTAYIPAWSIHFEAKDDKQALDIARGSYNDHMEQDPQFGEIIIEKTNKDRIINKKK